MQTIYQAYLAEDIERQKTELNNTSAINGKIYSKKLRQVENTLIPPSKRGRQRVSIRLGSKLCR